MFQKQESFNLEQEKKALILTNDLTNDLVKAIDEKFKGKVKNISTEPFTTIYTLGYLAADKIHVIDQEAFGDEDKRKKILKAITNLKDESILLLDTFEESLIADLFEGLLYSGYIFDKLKSKKEDEKPLISYTMTKNYEALIEQGLILGEAINHTRDLVNTPYNFMNSLHLADYAKGLERFEGVTVKIIEKDEIEQMNMGAFLGVNKGSTEPPKLIYVEYNGDKSSKDKTALVGKGVMYDTGGYSLKTPQYMPTMKMDMGGSATVLGAIEAIARLKYKANVSVVVAATDNRIGDHAIVPDDILTAANGLTIEIVSTDAEGRLTLADALWYAQKQGATKLIDVATLTGAIVAALGDSYTGAFTNNTEFLNQLQDVTEQTNDLIWQMPIHEKYRKELKSYSADISNKGGRMAGSSIAAAFLEKFIENDTPWIHLDIAGVAFNSKDGATGRMVKNLTQLFK